MNRKITELFILIGFFCVLVIGSNSTSSLDTLLNVIFVILLVILQLSKSFFKVRNIYFSIVEIIAIIILKSSCYNAVEMFVPIIIYEIFNVSYANYISLFSFTLISFLFFKIEVVYFSIYAIMINLYLYESEKQHRNTKELKQMNKLQSAQKFMLQERMTNMNKYLEQKDLVAGLKERSYMAQKVHDHLGHRITSSIMQLEVTKATLGKDNETSLKYLLTAMDSLRCGMEEIRSFLKNAKPGEKIISIEDVKKQLLEFQFNTGIKTHFEIKGDIAKLNISILQVISENLREALTNASKYSGATNIYFILNIYNKFIRVEIKDDGCGAVDIKKSLGLTGMEERIRGIGGRIEFSSKDGFIINMIMNI